MNQQRGKLHKTLEKDLLAVEKQERKLERLAQNAKSPTWKTELERRLPANVYAGLEAAFSKGFSLVFRQGRVVIEKGYQKEELQADYDIREYAVQRKGGKKELKQFHRSAKRSDFVNLAVTTAEGVGLGILGIGMPDVVLFLGILLKGVYETALHYGFDYDTPQEQMLILKMMETALSNGSAWQESNAGVDHLLTTDVGEVTEEMLDAQIHATASAFAVDMLAMKFLQGLPIVGVLGGAANPVYYSRVMNYVRLKYRKRYLMMHRRIV